MVSTEGDAGGEVKMDTGRKAALVRVVAGKVGGTVVVGRAVVVTGAGGEVQK